MEAVFGRQGVPQVSPQSLEMYRAYLEEQLPKDCPLTGLEEFEWEIEYLEGYGDLTEWEKLRQVNASCMDNFRLLEIGSVRDDADDLLARVERVGDSREFEIGLSWLVAADTRSGAYDSLWCFSQWWARAGT